MLKALQHNKQSALKRLPTLCPLAFGPATVKAWKKAKPNLSAMIGYDRYYHYYFLFYDVEGETALEKRTVAELKDILRDLRLKVSGKKAELIDRITSSYLDY